MKLPKSLRRIGVGLAAAAVAVAGLAVAPQFAPSANAEELPLGTPVTILSAANNTMVPTNSRLYLDRTSGSLTPTTGGRIAQVEMFQVDVNGQTYPSYCIEYNVPAQNQTSDDQATLAAWADFHGRNNFATSQTVRESVSWIVHNSAPAVSRAELEAQIPAVRSLSHGELIAVTQAAIWNLTDNVGFYGLVEVYADNTTGYTANSGAAVDFYNWLLDSSAVGTPERLTSAPTLTVTGPTTVAAGQIAGPFTVATDARSVELVLANAPAGSTFVDAQGQPMDVSALQNGAQVYVQIPAGASSVNTVSVIGYAAGGTLASAVINTPVVQTQMGTSHAQTLIVSDDTYLYTPATASFAVTAPAQVVFSKVDLGGNELPGADIQILQNGNVVDEWTSTTTAHEMMLAAGEYVFHEVAAPNGYEVVTDITFTVAADGTITVVNANGNELFYSGNTLVVTDQATSLPVNISKVDIAGKELPGAQIEIRQGNTVVEAWTSTDVPHATTLQPGEYVFHEVAAPNGYEVVTDITFTVNMDGAVTVTNINGNEVTSHGNTLVVTDQTSPVATPAPTGTPVVTPTLTDTPVVTPTPTATTPAPQTINVSKVDIAGKELPGAQIEITDANGKVIESWTSGETPKQIQLTSGEYVFHEVAAPNGYQVVTDITFTVDLSGNVTVTNVNGNEVTSTGNTLTVTDQDAPQTINVSKVDIAGKELPGAQIEITDSKGTVIESWISGETPKQIQLLPGEYLFHEVNAPLGYSVVTDITFTVDHAGNVTVTNMNGNEVVAATGNTLVVTDQDAATTGLVPPTPVAPQTINVSKVDIAGAELPGAQIEIRQNGSIVEAWISTETPHAVALKPGEYLFHEVAAPVGYQVVTDITFSVDVDGTVTVINANGNTVSGSGSTLTVTDQDASKPQGMNPLPVVISKVDIAGNELPGAQIELQHNGAVVESWTSETAPHQTALLPGEYVFHEVAAPNGYQVVTDITFTVNPDGTIAVTDLNGNQVTSNGNTLVVTDQDAPAATTPGGNVLTGTNPAEQPSSNTPAAQHESLVTTGAPAYGAAAALIALLALGLGFAARRASGQRQEA